jgi:anti-sigma factor ChrR (cupin superfamily)
MLFHALINNLHFNQTQQNTPHRLSEFLHRRADDSRLLGQGMVFTHDMSNWLGFNIDDAWLQENVSWKDFGTGVRLGKLKREDKTSLVLYEAQSEVEVDAFMPHNHPGGECYVVLEGEVWDEDGTYPTGSIVWMDPESTHTPKTRGKTLILVLWPQGVKAA